MVSSDVGISAEAQIHSGISSLKREIIVRKVPWIEKLLKSISPSNVRSSKHRHCLIICWEKKFFRNQGLLGISREMLSFGRFWELCQFGWTSNDRMIVALSCILAGHVCMPIHICASSDSIVGWSTKPLFRIVICESWRFSKSGMVHFLSLLPSRRKVPIESRIRMSMLLEGKQSIAIFSDCLWNYSEDPVQKPGFSFGMSLRKQNCQNANWSKEPDGQFLHCISGIRSRQRR